VSVTGGRGIGENGKTTPAARDVPRYSAQAETRPRTTGLHATRLCRPNGLAYSMTNSRVGERDVLNLFVPRYRAATR